MTPGPWRVEPQEGHYGGYRILGPSIGGKLGIFFPTIAIDLTFEDAQQRLADAKAIAALPALVEELLECREHMFERQDADGDGDGGFTGNAEMRRLVAIDEVLRKAGIPTG